jgi:hypothetical protein
VQYAKSRPVRPPSAEEEAPPEGGPNAVARTDLGNRLLNGLLKPLTRLAAKRGLTRCPLTFPRHGSLDVPDVRLRWRQLWQFVAALLAAHGCAAVSLPHFGYEDVPKELIEFPSNTSPKPSNGCAADRKWAPHTGACSEPIILAGARRPD